MILRHLNPEDHFNDVLAKVLILPRIAYALLVQRFCFKAFKRCLYAP